VMGLCQTQKETVLSKKAMLVMPQEWEVSVLCYMFSMLYWFWQFNI
jgi:hypothetical protein